MDSTKTELYDDSVSRKSEDIEEDFDKLIEEVIDTYDPGLAELFKLYDSVELYLEDIGSLIPIPLTREAEYRLVREAQNGSLDTKNKLINSHLSLVTEIAGRYKSSNLHFLDLVQEGNIGLICAVNTFDQIKGCSFSTYATWCIHRAIHLALAKKSRMIRVPIHLHNKIIKIRHCRTQLQEQLGREPTKEELAYRMDCSPESIRKATFIPKERLSPLEDDFAGSPVDDLTRNPGEKSEASDFEELQIQAVHRAMEILSELEAHILRCRFGLSGQQYNLNELGKELGLTQKQVREIQNKALEKLRHSSMSRELLALCDA